MATPHVTGAIALAPLDLIHYSSRDAAMKALQKKSQASYCGFSGDPDTSEEPMVYVGQPDTDCGLLVP
jgi:hypothetical protein